MGNVLFVVAPDYPDMETVHERLLKGSKTEHVTYMRKNDPTMRGIAQVLGIELQEFQTRWCYTTRVFIVDSKGEITFGKSAPRRLELGVAAYVEEALHTMDFVIVYATQTSSVTKPFIKKATKYPYNIIFGHKVEINMADTKLVKRRKGRKRAQGD